MIGVSTSNVLYASRIRGLLGEEFIFGIAPPAVSDPYGKSRCWITCKRHRTYKIIDVSDELSFPTDEEIMKAAQSCYGCIEEQASLMPATRWPEGAEL